MPTSMKPPITTDAARSKLLGAAPVLDSVDPEPDEDPPPPPETAVGVTTVVPDDAIEAEDLVGVVNEKLLLVVGVEKEKLLLVAEVKDPPDPPPELPNWHLPRAIQTSPASQ
ncbi:hypothetical protein Slin14017_G087730 [Septoria linicola]|nr:hypothetical protein Slin14017_G087730 [Septoria linicola]